MVIQYIIVPLIIFTVIILITIILWRFYQVSGFIHVIGFLIVKILSKLLLLDNISDLQHIHFKRVDLLFYNFYFTYFYFFFYLHHFNLGQSTNSTGFNQWYASCIWKNRKMFDYSLLRMDTRVGTIFLNCVKN